MNTYAVDFETYYDEDLSVTTLGAVNYAAKTDIYMVAIYGPGVEYVGGVLDAPWHQIAGEHWVSHNASFDVAIYNAAFPSYLGPWHSPSVWDCTADLCAYLGIPRSLKDAVAEAYGKELDKAMRAGAKGKHWPQDFKPEQQQRMLEYALRDAKYCWQLWEDLSKDWPEEERQLSRITRVRGHQGVNVYKLGLLADIGTLAKVKADACAKIPWSHLGVILSPRHIKDYCEQHDLPIPASLAETSEECAQWEATYGDKHPVVGAIRDYRKTNRMQRTVEGMLDRIMPNGRMNFGLKYCGAHTGRWSGSDGLNMQNPNKTPVFGVDLRARIIAGEGKKFVIADLAQIEPRCAAWLTEDTVMLDALKNGYGVYEAFAKSTGFWDGEAGTFKKGDPNLYDLVKAQVLALGYGAGPAKFIIMAKQYCGLELSLDRAEEIVSTYRKKNHRVVAKWEWLEEQMRISEREKAQDPLHRIKLPSGRVLTYSRLSYHRKEDEPWRQAIHACAGRGKIEFVWWGGKLWENVVQATARDVLAFAILALEGAGIPVLWSTHDEVICQVDIDFDAQIIKNIMTKTPPWLSGLVLDAEVVESQHYLK